MLILHDGNPLVRIKRPWVNQGLLLLTAGMFALQLSDLIGWRQFAFFPAQLWNLWPVPGPLNGAIGLVTHLFLHGDILHLAANLVALAVFGNNVEDALGHWRYLILYLLAGALGAVAQGLLSDPFVPLIGASAAVSGVMGGYLLLHPRAHVLILAFNVIPVIAPASLAVAFTILVNIAMAYDVTLLTGGIPEDGQLHIAWWGHIGGFACGIVGVPLLKARDVPLFQPPPALPARSMRWLRRFIPTLAWPGGATVPEESTRISLLASSRLAAEPKYLVIAKALGYVVLILLLMRFL